MFRSLAIIQRYKTLTSATRKTARHKPTHIDINLNPLWQGCLSSLKSVHGWSSLIVSLLGRTWVSGFSGTILSGILSKVENSQPEI
jgi:hypothetical protein